MGIFWDSKEQYFRELMSKDDLPADRRANLHLLESLLDKAYRDGYRTGFRNAMRDYSQK
jgi:hypothetical protein